MKTTIFKATAVFVLVLASLIFASCNNDEFLDAINAIFDEAKFNRSSPPKYNDGNIYLPNGAKKITTIWDNPQKTRYDAVLVGADANFARAKQDEEDRTKVYIYIEDGVEKDALDITLQLKAIKGEIKKEPRALPMHIIFIDGDEVLEDDDEDAASRIVPLGIDGNLKSTIDGIVNTPSGGEAVTITLSHDSEFTESVYIRNGFDITLKADGKSIKRGGSFTGPLFIVENLATLTLKDVTLDGGAIWTGGDSTVNPPSPAFGASNDTSAGGVNATAPLVKVSGADAKLTLGNNAVIKNNCYATVGATTVGGGVALELGGTLVMNSDTARIEYNRAHYQGGGVYLTSGAHFELKKGSLDNNHVTNSDGGGLYLGNGGIFEMKGGYITKNRAAGSGGGVVMVERAAFKMSGGEISGNTAVSGKGVYIIDDSSSGGAAHNTFTMSGSAKVGGDNDVHLESGKTITIGGALSAGAGASITPSAWTAGRALLSGTSAYLNEANIAKFSLASPPSPPSPPSGSYAIDPSDGKLARVMDVNGIGLWLKAKEAIQNGGNNANYIVRLTGDVAGCSGSTTSATFGTVTGLRVTLKGNKNVSLATTSSGIGALIKLGGGQTLVLDGPTLKGRSDNAYAVIWLNDYTNTNTEFIFKAGSIEGNSNSSIGGGVSVNTGIFTMKGGTIKNNSASQGGGVYIHPGAHFSKAGGIIYGNTSTVHSSGGDNNTATQAGNQGGHAVYYENGGKRRNNTLNSGDNLSTSNIAGWN